MLQNLRKPRKPGEILEVSLRTNQSFLLSPGHFLRQGEIKSDKVTRLKIRNSETRSDRLKQEYVGYGEKS
jgi:hypothetical protein